ncbi:PHB depolymerase family esterase [Catellatospora sp. NPDC049609]|uniref:alpha/beta hydrolase family esterase n=1 Tax=Catellatospora sp. NPDC049609 TaxID=3155505 RepID=UPI003431A8A1
MKRVIALAGIVTVLTACGSTAETPPTPPPAPEISLPAENPGPGEHAQAIVHGGVRRDYTVHAPPAYRPGLPLVLVLHGQPGTSAEVAQRSGFNPVADRAGFLAVYPQGFGNRWDVGTVGDPGSGDVGFLAGLIDHLVSVWGADRARVYVTGFSAGAAFSYRLARELPGRFAAIAPVSGKMDPVPAWQSPLGPDNRVSVLTFQGGRDLIASAWSATNDGWRAAAGCGTPKLTTVRNARGVADREVASCANGTEHVVYALRTMGHEWPNAVEHPVAGSDLIWEFFSRHRLP